MQQTEKIFANPTKTAISIIQKRGILGLWSGFGVTVFGSSPSIALYFGCYSTSKKHLEKVLPEKFKLVAVCVAAAFGNTVASVLRVPYEVVKQRLQVGIHKSTSEAVMYILKEEGIGGLLGSGRLASQMLRDVPYAVATLLTYEILQAFLSKRLERKKVKDMVCGSLAGGIGAFMTTPLDLIKTRMMIGGKYETILSAINTITKEEGISAFMIGMAPRLMHKIPANGLFFLFYESFKSMLGVEGRKE